MASIKNLRYITFLLFSCISWFSAFGQFTDSFSDGEFTSNPAWNGNVSVFTVNASQQLQLNNTVAASSALYTANNLTSLDSMEWSFYIKLSFAPSSSNYSRVYLVSDNSNLLGPLNGYYLQFGETGALDAVQLFKQTGTTSTSIARGADARIAAAFAVGVRVTRNSAGTWKLYVDPAGGTNYALEASGVESSITTSSFFGVAAVYTSSNANKFFYDDFYVGPIIVDTAPPALLSVSVISPNQLDVIFNEPVSTPTAENISNYILDQGMGNPSSAVRDASNASLVHLTFPTNLVNSTNYTLTATGIADATGNVQPSQSFSFFYFVPDVPAFKDVIINEIMADPTPSVGLPELEFVEIYNRSNKYFQLAGWTIGDPSTTGVLGTYVLKPGEYVILSKNADTSAFVPFGKTVGSSVFPSLNNAGDQIYLKDNNASFIDSVSFTDAMYNDATKKLGGWTLELINPDLPTNCPSTANWIASNDPSGGTPGKINSVFSNAADVTAPTVTSSTALSATQIEICFSEPLAANVIGNTANYTVDNGIGNPTSITVNGQCAVLNLASALVSGTYTVSFTNINDCAGNALSTTSVTIIYSVAGYNDVIINEIMADPTPVVGLPDQEFVELYNRSSSSIDLSGWYLTAGTSKKQIQNGVSIGANSYLVLSTVSGASALGISNAVGLASFPSLTNSGSLLTLQDKNSNYIDSVRYSDQWYKDAAKINGGWTLERINPDYNPGCTPLNNWAASVNSFGGTPGAINSIFSTIPDSTGPTVGFATVIDETHIRLCFNEPMDAQFMLNVGHYNIDPFMGVPVSAVFDDANTCVTLTVLNPLQKGNTYQVTVDSLKDCSGNLTLNQTAPFVYYEAAARDIVINEIMADPDPVKGLPNYEYVELFNKTAFSISIDGWFIQIGSSKKVISNVTVPAGGYVVLSSIAGGLEYNSLFPGIPAYGVTGFPTLTNSGQNITLYNGSDLLIDSVFYSSTWFRDAAKDDGGWSLELINPNKDLDCNPSFNWAGSIDSLGGTPGKVNSIYNPAPDVSSPQLLSLLAVDSTMAQICFNEPMNPAFAVVGSYFVSNGIGTPDSVKLSADGTCADLYFSNKFIDQQSYTLNLSGIEDCSGNALVQTSYDFSFYVAQQYDVVINEILADPDPATGLPPHEYLELFNNSDFPINVSNWSLQVGSNTKLIPSITIPSKAYVAITNINNIGEFSPFNNVYGMTSFPALTNSGAAVTLKDSRGRTIHHVSYSDKWYKDDVKAEGGWSLEMIDPNNPCAGAENWKASADPKGGTPGKQNSIFGSYADVVSPEIMRISVFDETTLRLFFSESVDSSTVSNPLIYTIDNNIGNPKYTGIIGPDYKTMFLTLNSALVPGVIYTLSVSGTITDCAGNLINTDVKVRFAVPQAVLPNDIVINEILADPKTDGVDFVEVYNRSSKVLDLGALNISSFDTVNQTLKTVINIFPEGFLMFPGDHIVLTSDPEVVMSQYKTGEKGLFIKTSIPSLSISSGTVVISDVNGLIIDKVTYRSSWHFPLLLSTKGVSLERIDPERPSQDATNWHSASEAVGFATPALKNSQYNDTPEVDDFLVLQPEIFSPDNDGYNDVLNISYRMEKGGFVSNIIIFDAVGRIVRTLQTNELLGITGTISWDGISDTGEKAEIGMYVIYFEAFHPDGDLKKIKKVAVLAGRL